MALKGTATERFPLFLRDFTKALLRDHKLVAIYFREEINTASPADILINRISA